MYLILNKPGLRLSKNELIETADVALSEQSRIWAADARIEIWNQSNTGAPAGSIFLLAHRVYLEIDDFDQLIWFHRSATRDELWAYTDIPGLLGGRLHKYSPEVRVQTVESCRARAACVFSVPRQATVDVAVVELLTNWLNCPAGALIDIKMMTLGGFLSRPTLKIIWERIKRLREHQQQLRDENIRRAHSRETEIIHVARELGLAPRPAGTGEIQWYANCPQTNHSLMITTSDDQFGCGYCRRKGGVDELREFVTARRS